MDAYAAGFRDVDPARRILMGPGPSDVPDRVLRALSAPTIGHLDPAFLDLLEETQSLLRTVFQTKNALTIPVSGTGSAGMEACFVNLVQPGDQVVVIVNGVFGTRMCDVASRMGADVLRVEVEWGRAADPEAVREAVRGRRPTILAAVHAETSTGACQQVPELAAIAHECGALLVLDCVTSLGGIEVAIDSWDVDAVYSGTQKCLSCPPGLAPLSFGPRAVEALEQRTTSVASWYLDLTMVRDYWGSSRKYHHTAPVNMIYALRESLRIIVEEGLAARFERHRLHHRALVAGLGAMGLEMLVPPEERLVTLNAVSIPDEVDDAGVRADLLRHYGIEIGGGLGPLTGRIWRVGLMGHSASERNVLLFLGALESVLEARGVAVGGGQSAAVKVYASAGT